MGASEKPGGGRSGDSPGLQDKVIQQRIRAAIRQVWTRYSPERKEALYQAKRTKKQKNKNGETSKRPDVSWICASCKEQFKGAQVQVDHIEPVGKTPIFPPAPEDTSWSTWLLRLFCVVDNLQVLCKECHQIKTKKEKQDGKAHRSKKAIRKRKQPRNTARMKKKGGK